MNGLHTSSVSLNIYTHLQAANKKYCTLVDAHGINKWHAKLSANYACI